eukprot:gene1322-biopygen233
MLVWYESHIFGIEAIALSPKPSLWNRSHRFGTEVIALAPKPSLRLRNHRFGMKRLLWHRNHRFATETIAPQLKVISAADPGCDGIVPQSQQCWIWDTVLVYTSSARRSLESWVPQLKCCTHPSNLSQSSVLLIPDAMGLCPRVSIAGSGTPFWCTQALQDARRKAWCRSSNAVHILCIEAIALAPKPSLWHLSHHVGTKPSRWHQSHRFGTEAIALAPKPSLWHRSHRFGTEAIAVAPKPSVWHQSHRFGTEAIALALKPSLWHRSHRFGTEAIALAPKPSLWPLHHDYTRPDRP